MATNKQTFDKQALRDIAVAAKSSPSWYAVGEFGDVVDPINPEWKPVHEFCKTFTAARVLTLLDELDYLDLVLKSESELASRLIEAKGKNLALEEELEAKDRRIAELESDLSEWTDCKHDGATYYDMSGRERCGRCGADI